MNVLINVNIAELAKKVAEDMIATVDANAKDYIEYADFESVFETCFDKAIVGTVLKGDSYSYLYQTVIKHPEVDLAFATCAEIRMNARAEAEDEIKYHENPMKYYGLKASDFV